MNPKKIAIINLGIGNSKSVYNALSIQGIRSEIIEEGYKLLSYSHVIIPGVGAFDSTINSMKKNGLYDQIKEFYEAEKPILGICLGMQILFTSSDEGNEMGLNFIPGNLKRIRKSEFVNVPNTGWQNIRITQPGKLLNSTASLRMYHNHSYAFQEKERPEVSAVLESAENIVVGVEKKAVFGVQFHPEKSHRAGLDILKKFTEI